ncbi:hypothetical protein SISNIDRAFT_458563 [Sistotremastrum niveocremeum HHB9708]|uniref:Uncharacterized protein n=1 Tax=Sistotremastrum niveocremeum HHB9708 TaxID=1314777 RepID=A0A164QG38_9AGAM|nr:hypothetical protein SISNIDRAFT_458563 [Sistotremastrum niveocremeum HHB9708]
MNVGTQLSRRELSAHGLSLQRSVPNLMDVLERALSDAQKIDYNPNVAPLLRDIATHLRSASSTLGRISNMQIPIGRLPDEVLSEILLCTLIAIVDDADVIDPCDWEYLLHVCSRWTTIIHADPRFWSCIDFTWNLPTIDRFISLSKAALLSLRIPATNNFSLDQQNRLLSIVSRAKDINITYHLAFRDCLHTNEPRPASAISSLVLNENSSSAIQCLVESLKAPAPQLSHLAVNCGHEVGVSSLQHLSSLTSVELHDCTLQESWNSIFPTSLRRVRIAYGGRFGQSGVDVVNIVHLLVHCQKLDSLDITGTRINAAPADFQIEEIISAPQLRHLSMDGMAASEWDLLSDHIQAPALSKIHATVALESQKPLLPGFLRLCAAEASHATLVFERIHITCTYSGTQTVPNLFQHVMTIVYDYNTILFPNFNPGPIQVSDLDISFKQLNSLTIEINYDTGIQWVTLLENMSSLVALDVRGRIGADFFEALSGCRTDLMVCPCLSSLGIRTANHCFDIGTATMNGHPHGTDPWEESRSWLCHCLSWRMLHGCKLRKLITHPQWLAGEYLRRLLRSVDTIENTHGLTIWF